MLKTKEQKFFDIMDGYYIRFRINHFPYCIEFCKKDKVIFEIYRGYIEFRKHKSTFYFFEKKYKMKTPETITFLKIMIFKHLKIKCVVNQHIYA